jgi:NAD(P)H dehydrogenase (quinone)
MPAIAIVYFSASGHTQQLAHAVADGARSVAGTQAELLRIQGSDIREGRWKNDEILQALQRAEAIVFGTPTYMGGISGQFKAFIDGCSGVWYQQSWRNKLAAGFTHSQGLSGDKLATLQGLMTNALQHSMLWVGTGVLVEGTQTDHVNRLSSFAGVMAQSDGNQAQIHEGDRRTGFLLGQRVAETAHRWNKA